MKKHIGAGLIGMNKYKRKLFKVIYIASVFYCEVLSFLFDAQTKVENNELVAKLECQ